MPTGMSSLAAVAGSVFRLVATARGARAVHPRGRTFTATVHTVGGEWYGVPLFDRAGAWPALVRFSRGAGLPEPWPDVLGVALRVTGAGGPGVDLDLLFSTTLGIGPGVRHVPGPGRHLAGPYATVAGYRTRLGRRHFALLPGPAGLDLGTRQERLDAVAATGGAALLLASASRTGRWRALGRVVLDAPVPPAADAALQFDPVVRQVPGLAPDGLLQRVRAGAYAGSRAGRSRRASSPVAGSRR
jgi:hypothetical protein